MYKARFIAISSTTTDLSQLLISCLLLSSLVSLGTMRQCLKGQGFIKHFNKVLRNLKSGGFGETRMSTNALFNSLYHITP